MNRYSMKAPVAIVFGAAVLLTALFSPLSWAKPSAKNDSAMSTGATIQRLETDIPELMKNGGVPGLSIAVIRRGRTWWVRGFGVKDAKSGGPVTGDTVFEAASLSKPVFAYGVLKLVEQGKLDLDVPLTKYLPKPYIEGDARLDKITARLVLSHRTGFPNWRDGNTLRIYFTPGERFSYSGEGYVYLQRVVEQITGESLNDYMTKAVFTPLGMASSSYVWQPEFDQMTATGHNADGEPAPIWKPKEAGAASTLNTTVGDYARFVEAVINGKGLKPATFRAMESPEVALDPDCRNCTLHSPTELSPALFWGLGWGIQRTSVEDALWHWGDNGGFKSFVMAQPKSKSAVVMFANSDNGLSIAKQLINEAMGTPSIAFAWLKYDAYDSVAAQFARAAMDEGLPRAIEEFDSALKSGSISEDSLDALAHRLFNKKKSDSVRLFQLNVELHPQSSNAYENLAETYLRIGDKAHAIKSYEKLLKLDSQNQNAIDKLTQLKAGQ